MQKEPRPAKLAFIVAKVMILFLLVLSAAIHGHPVEECVVALMETIS